MTRTDLLYTYIAKGRYWRFRHPVTGDVKLPGQPGDADFHSRYGELMAQVERGKKAAQVKSGSWTAIIRQYRSSTEFKALSDSTQIDYTRTLDALDAELGEFSFRLTTPTMIRTVRDDFSDKPRKAHKIKQMASALYSWADERGIVPPGFNPAKDVRRLKRKGGHREYICWSEFEFDLFMSKAIEPLKTAVMLARYTGQRSSDLAKMTWGDFQGDMIRVRQQKTGAPLDIPCHVDLIRYLNELRTRQDSRGDRGLVILTSAIGRPYNSNSLSSAVVRQVKAIEGMPQDRSIHGLRYMAGADLEECGCTVGQIQSILGHHAYQMAMKYATQRLRAREAVAKRDRNEA